MKPTRGTHPVMSKKNTHTGKNDVNVPSSTAETVANIRQSIARLLGSVDKTHSFYKMFAYASSTIFMDTPKDAFLVSSMIAINRINDGDFGDIDDDAKSAASLRAVKYNLGDYYYYKENQNTQVTAGITTFSTSLEATVEAMNAKADLPKSLSLLPKLAADTLTSIIIPYNRLLTAEDIIPVVTLCKRLLEFDVTGCINVINDAVLMALGRNCPCLETLLFGVDNIYLPPINVSVQGLVFFVTNCAKVRNVAILQQCKGGRPYTKGSGIHEAMCAQQFKVVTVADAKDAKILRNDPILFWRLEIEDNFRSAQFYARSVGKGGS